MQANFDFLIIETYTELAVVLLVLAAAAVVVGWLWARARRLRTSNRRRGVPIKKSRRVTGPPSAGSLPAAVNFDTLASMISDANDRAGHIVETQSAAALKLDSAEMAVNRLIADIGGVMPVPAKLAAPLPAQRDVVLERATQSRAAPRGSRAA